MIDSILFQGSLKSLGCFVAAALLGMSGVSCKSMKGAGSTSEYPEYATSNDGAYNPYPGQSGYQTYTPSNTPAQPQYQQYTPPPSYTPSPTPEPEPSYTPAPKPKKKTPAKSSSSSKGGRYTVKQGDTLYRIALRNNTTVSRLKTANGLSSDVIRTGQTLRIP